MGHSAAPLAGVAHDVLITARAEAVSYDIPDCWPSGSVVPSGVLAEGVVEGREGDFLKHKLRLQVHTVV